MAETRTDPHAAILTWLDENGGHDVECDVYDVPLHGGRPDTPVCDCVEGKLAAAAYGALKYHVATKAPGEWCSHDGFAWPCLTVQAIADALGVAK